MTITIKGLIGIRATKCDELLDKMKDHPHILLIKKTKNYHDMIAIVRHDSMKSLSEFIFQEIRSIKCVNDTETTILIEE